MVHIGAISRYKKSCHSATVPRIRANLSFASGAAQSLCVRARGDHIWVTVQRRVGPMTLRASQASRHGRPATALRRDRPMATRASQASRPSCGDGSGRASVPAYLDRQPMPESATQLEMMSLLEAILQPLV
jgi:hypothetical protein